MTNSLTESAMGAMAMLTLGTEAIMSRLNGRQQGIGKEARKKKKAKRRAVKQARRKH